MTSTERSTNRLLSTSEGETDESFSSLDWALVTFISATWGASFLLMAIGLDDFEPGAVTLARVGFGAITLNLMPAARRRFAPDEQRRILFLGVLWVALPLTFFPIAQQWIDSAVAGMLNAATPAVTAVVASIMLRRPPGSRQRLGILVGFIGVVCISAPTIGDGDTAWLGVMLVIGATLCYGVSINVVAPLQQRHGSLPVLARVQMVAAIAVAPWGLYGVNESSFSWGALAAVMTLGILGTGFAYAAFGQLIGHVGGTRASIVTYLIPLVAVVLGVVVRDESISWLAGLGCALVLCGAWLSSRAGR